MELHAAIKQKLKVYVDDKSVPNLLFHGEYGTGKRTLVRWYIDLIYSNNKDHKDTYVMWVNCACGKNIKFIRDSIKYFAKTNINLTDLFKVIVLTNADELSTDAQSALRRCIEQFNTFTRFFIITTKRHKLLKPIISRFCDIYVHTLGNMHATLPCPRATAFQKFMTQHKHQDPMQLADELFSAAFSAADLAHYVEDADIDTTQKYTWLLYYEKIRGDFRCETMLLFVLLHAYIFRTDPVFKVFL